MKIQETNSYSKLEKNGKIVRIISENLCFKEDKNLSIFLNFFIFLMKTIPWFSSLKSLLLFFPWSIPDLITTTGVILLFFVFVSRGLNINLLLFPFQILFTICFILKNEANLS